MGFKDRRQKPNKTRTIWTTVVAAIFLTLVAGSSGLWNETHASARGNNAANNRAEYVQRLIELSGSPYLELQCSTYICVAKRHEKCTAAEIWEGCRGAMEIAQEAKDFASLDENKLQSGDVVVFNGIHVGAYVGNGVWMDATPERGVAELKLPTNPFDPWYRGMVRILRWKV